jgi:hypothetical protein
VKALGDDDQVFKVQGQAVVASNLAGEKNRQAVALTLPEEAILDQPRRWFKLRLGLGRTETSAHQPLFGLRQEVLQLDRILLDLQSHPMGGHEEGHVPAITPLAHLYQIVSTQYIHAIPLLSV